MAVGESREPGYPPDIMVVKDMGLVAQVFNEHMLAALHGHAAIGHTRYSTTGSSVWSNAQPVHRLVTHEDGSHSQFALAHNGNLTNTPSLLERSAVLPGTLGSDTEVLAELIEQHLRADELLPVALAQVLPHVEGAWSLVFTDGNCIVGARDPHGFRPLCLGKLPGGVHPASGCKEDGWVIASESPALDVVGATFVREIEPGEMVVVDEEGVRFSRLVHEGKVPRRLCVFEYVYFARPDAVLFGKEVHGTRQRMGEALARMAPLPPARSGNKGCEGMVIGVPDSGIPAAEGFARASNIPYGQGLIKNRYIGRTFIAPDQGKRINGVRRKLNPLRENIAGKRLVVLDDSIVRGTTSKQMVRMLHEAGAAEVHLRITSPPYKWPCFYGMDTGDPSELVAAKLSVEQIRDHIGCDTLSYLTLDGLLQAVGNGPDVCCTACLSGDYPTDVSFGVGKHALEDLMTQHATHNPTLKAAGSNR